MTAACRSAGLVALTQWQLLCRLCKYDHELIEIAYVSCRLLCTVQRMKVAWVAHITCRHRQRALGMADGQQQMPSNSVSAVSCVNNRCHEFATHMPCIHHIRLALAFAFNTGHAKETRDLVVRVYHSITRTSATLH